VNLHWVNLRCLNLHWVNPHWVKLRCKAGERSCVILRLRPVTPPPPPVQ